MITDHLRANGICRLPINFVTFTTFREVQIANTQSDELDLVQLNSATQFFLNFSKIACFHFHCSSLVEIKRYELTDQTNANDNNNTCYCKLM